MARLSILIYHRVLGGSDPLQPSLPTAALFERHMRWLKRLFHVMRLDDAVQALRQRRLPSRALCITFDDGYADNCDVALPILKRLRLPATFFIATGFLNGGRMWNDTVIEAVRHWPDATLACPEAGVGGLSVDTSEQKRLAIERLLPALKYLSGSAREAAANRLALKTETPLPRLMMRDAQVRGLHEAGMTIGAHTQHHPTLSSLPDGQAHDEILGGRKDLEALVGAPIELFAYPNGEPGKDYTVTHVHMVRELGFAAGVTTQWGAADEGSDLYQLPRFTPWDRAGLLFTGRLLGVRLRRGPEAA